MRELFVGFLIFQIFPLWAQRFEPIDAQSEVTFKIKHFGIPVEGTFSGLKGVINWNQFQQNKSTIDVAVDAASIHTGIDLRDKHLKMVEYFDISSYNLIRFQSTQVISTAEGLWRANGKLTAKGNAHDCSIPFHATKHGNDLELTGVLVINRNDFGIGGYHLGMADSVSVILRVRLHPIENLVQPSGRDIH